MEPPKRQFRIAARTLILNDKNELLLVANSQKQSWFTPGGRVEPEETLEEAAIRETFEETGITVKDLKLIYVRETADHSVEKPQRHICFYFLARTDQKLPEAWTDHDGYVDLNRFFNRDELKSVDKVWPEILRERFWLDLDENFENAEIYANVKFVV